jgi:hypothetical protein
LANLQQRLFTVVLVVLSLLALHRHLLHASLLLLLFFSSFSA